jgi:uncharacterized delta-60 repeat protein
VAAGPAYHPVYLAHGPRSPYAREMFSGWHRVFFNLGLIAMLPADRAGAAPGAVDPGVNLRFESPGKVSAMTVQPDGKWIVGGTFTAVNGVDRGKVARLHPDGSLDPSFDPGPINPDIYDRSEIYGLSLQGDKVLAAGFLSHLAGQPASAVVRLNANGTRDTTFNPPVFTNSFDPAAWIAIDRGDGKVLVGGRFSSVGGQARANLVRLDSSGAIDPTFNPAVNGTVQSAVAVSGDRWLIGGSFTTVSGQARPGIARIQATGAIDPGFATVPLAAGSTISSLSLQADGKILYAGYQGATRFAGRALADGGADPGFTPAAVPGFLANALLLPDGDVMLDGPNGVFEGWGTSQLTRLQSNGTADPVAQASAFGLIYKLAGEANGSVLVGGNYSSFGNLPRMSLGKALPDGSVDPAFHPDVTHPSDVRRIIPLSGGGWLVTGSFYGALGGGPRVTHSRISRLTPSLTLDPGFVQPFSGTIIYATSAVEDTAGRLLIGTDSNSSATPRRIHRLGANGGIDPAFDVLLGTSNSVADIVLQPDGRILAAGNITQVNGTYQQHLTRLSADGVVETAFNIPQTGVLNDIALENGGRILTGGVNGLKRLQPSGQIDPGFNQSLALTGAIHAVASLPGQRVLIAGNFTALGGQPAVRIARLDAAGNPDPTFQPGSGANGLIRSLQVRGDGDLFIAGDFTTFNGQPRRGIAQLSPDGALRPAFDPGEGFNGSVHTLALTADGHVLAGGAFTRANAVNRAGFAKMEPAPLQSTPPPPSSPGTPTATALSSQKVLVLWSDSSGESGYVVERREPGSTDWITLARPGAGSTFYNDETVVPGKTYEYRVLAWNPSGDAPLALSPAATVPTRAGLAGSPVPGDALDLWNAGEIRAVTRQADGKFVIAGTFTHINGTPRSVLARLEANGELDPTFVPDPAIVASKPSIQSLAVQSTGRIIVGSNGSLSGLAPDGTLDPAFTPPSSFSAVYELAVLPDDKLLVGGNFSRGSRPYLARTTADGAIDLTFANAGLNGEVDAIVVLPDGKILVSGGFTLAGFVTTSVARFNSNGSLDSSFAPVTLAPPPGAAKGLGTTMALQGDGKILVGGSFSSVNGQPRNSLVRLESNGAVDTTFVSGTSPNDFLHYVGLLPDGKVTIGGQFESYGGTVRSSWAVLTSTGALDPGNAVIRSGYVRRGVRLPDGRILVVGRFRTAAGVPHFGLVRLQADASTVDGTFNPQVAKPGTVSAITRQPDGKALVLGDFASVGGLPPSGVLRPTIFRIEPDGSIDDEFDAGSGFNNPPSVAATGPGGRIFVGGSFQSVNGVIRTGIAALNASGAVDPAFNSGNGANQTVYAIVPEAGGGATIAGTFTTVDGVPRPLIARLDETGGVTGDFDGGISTAGAGVLAGMAQEDGARWFGGTFSTLSGNSRAYLAKQQPDGSPAATATAPLDSQVRALIPQPGLSFFAGGNFTTVSGVPRARVARFTSTGALDPGFVPQLATSTAAPSTFAAFAADEAGRLYVAGSWQGSIPLRTLGLLRLSPDGSLDRDFDTGISGSGVTALAAINGGLLAGGSFTTWDDLPRYGLVRLRVQPSLVTPGAPLAFTATGGESGVDLAWEAVAGASGYLIEKRGASSTTWIPVATPPAGSLSFADATSPAGSRWIYRVSAFSSAGTSPSSPEVELILPTTYSQWKSDLGLPPGTADDDDTDRDGIPLILEYALALSPASADALGLPTIHRSANLLEFRYLHPRQDVTYVVEASTDLVHWSAEGVSTDQAAPYRVATIPLNGTKRFLRLAVRPPSP